MSTLRTLRNIPFWESSVWYRYAFRKIASQLLRNVKNCEGTVLAKATFMATHVSYEAER